MSPIAYILRAITLAVPVFFRFLPVAAIYGIMVLGLFLATDNIYVLILVGFLLATFGTAFLYLTGIRAGLMSLRATTAPTVDGLIRSTTRLLFVHFFAQLMLNIVLYTILLVFFHYVLLPAMAPDAYTLMAAPTLDADGAVVQPGVWRTMMAIGPALTDPQLAAMLNMPLMVLSLLFMAVSALCVGLFGVPMAATAANAVQHSPQNDLIFGFGAYFWPQSVLYCISIALPMVLTMAATPFLAVEVTSGLSSVTAIAVLVLIGAASLFAYCIPFSAMALGYTLTREKVVEERAASVRPVVNFEEQREGLRSLRRTRQDSGSGTTVYTPGRRSPPETD